MKEKEKSDILYRVVILYNWLWVGSHQTNERNNPLMKIKTLVLGCSLEVWASYKGCPYCT